MIKLVSTWCLNQCNMPPIHSKKGLIPRKSLILNSSCVLPHPPRKVRIQVKSCPIPSQWLSLGIKFMNLIMLGLFRAWHFSFRFFESWVIFPFILFHLPPQFSKLCSCFIGQVSSNWLSNYPHQSDLMLTTSLSNSLICKWAAKPCALLTAQWPAVAP